MGLEQDLVDRINDALKSKKVDVRFRLRFLRILDADDPALLEREVSYFVKGISQDLEFEGKIINVGIIYTAQSTYRVLLDNFENDDLKYFSWSGNMYPEG